MVESVYSFWQKFIKWIRKKNTRFECIATIASWMMKFAYHTTKWTIIDENIPNSYIKNDKVFIVCHWHDQLMVTPCVWKWKKPLHVLASSHRDGQMIAKIVENFGMIPVFGSTGKGVAAVRTLIKLIKNKEYIAIIPDGPRGPRHNAALGAIAIAQKTGVDILPYGFYVKRYFCLKSWDRFICIWPFNRGAMVWGQPVTAEELLNLSDEDGQKLLKNRIDEAISRAKKIVERK